MKLSELIQTVGEENIQVQFLNEAVVSAKAKKKTKNCEVTFATTGTTVDELMGRKPRNVGMIIWVAADKWPK